MKRRSQPVDSPNGPREESRYHISHPIGPRGISRELREIDHAMFATGGEDGFAQGKGAKVIPARDVGVLASFEGEQKPGHRAGKGVGEPGLGPSRPVPDARFVQTQVVDRAWNPIRPAGPSQSSLMPALASLEPPADKEVFTIRTGPDVIPGGGPRPVGVFEDRKVDAVVVSESGPGIGPGAGEDSNRVAKPIAECIKVVNAHDEGRERPAPLGPGHPVGDGPHLDGCQHRSPRLPRSSKPLSTRTEGSYLMFWLTWSSTPARSQASTRVRASRQLIATVLRQDAPRRARVGQQPMNHARLFGGWDRDVHHRHGRVVEHPLHRLEDGRHSPE